MKNIMNFSEEQNKCRKSISLTELNIFILFFDAHYSLITKE